MTLPQWTPAPGYTDLSLRQIRDEFGCTPIIPTPEITVPRPPLSPDIALPQPVRIAFFSVTPNLDETTNKNGVITFTITDRSNLTVYAKIYHISTSDNDFVGSIKWTINTNSGTLNFTVNTDNKTELLTEQFQVAFTVDEDDFDTAFFVSDPINIIDTSKYPVWNPGFIPSKDVVFTLSSGSLGDLRVKDAKPSSTFTGTVKYEGTGSPFTPNPKVITVQTVGADGTALVDSFYNVVGKYTYDIIYDNFSPDTIYEGTGRSFVAEIKQNLGTWKVNAVLTTIEGGQTLKFTWEVLAVPGSSLTELSWYIVNTGSNPAGSPPIPPVTYTGTGIPNKGTAFSIKRTVTTYSGDFTISTTEVTTNQQFVLMLYSGEIVNSAFLAQSQVVTIQPKPPIPDLVVSGDKVVVSPATVEWTIEGSIGEKVSYVYIDKNKSNTNYNIYFDYNPDVAAQFLIDNYGKSDQFAFAQYHYDNNGKKEGRKSPDELKALNASISGGGPLVLLQTATSTLKGYYKFSVQQGRQLLPRTSPYVFAFAGDKALNTKITPVEYSLTVSQKPSLIVLRTTNRIPYGSPVDVQIFGPFNANVEFAGPTNGFVQLNAAGSGKVDLRQGFNLTVNTHTWKFTSNIDCTNNGLEWSAIVENFLLNLQTKTAAEVPAGGWIGSGNSFTITLIRDYQGLISKISNPVIVFKGYPTGTATLVAATEKGKNPDYIMTFADNGEAVMPAHLRLGEPRDAGTVVFTLSSPTSTSPVTITVITRSYDELIYFSNSGVPTQVSPFTMNVSQELNWRIVGGVPNTEFTRKWVHDEKGAAGLPGLKLTDTPAGLTYKFDNNGNYQEDRNFFPTLSPGRYNYTFTAKATGKVLTPSIIVNNYDFTVTILPHTTGVGFNMSSRITARITSFPGDQVKISTPYWTTYRMAKNYHGQPVGYRFVSLYEGQDPNHLVAAYPVNNPYGITWNPETEYLRRYTDVAKDSVFKNDPRLHYIRFGYNEARTWPLYSGFPTKEVIIPDSGVLEVNLNGEAEKGITVQSSHYNVVSQTYWGTLDSYIKIGGTRTSPSSFGRGLTIAVIHPNSLALEFQQTYDTWGDSSTWQPFADKINSIPTGKIVVVVSYDAFRINWAMITALNSKLGTNLNSEMTYYDTNYTRANKIIVGYAGQPAKLQALRFNRYAVQDRVVVFPPDVTGGQGAPYLSSYNRKPLDKFQEQMGSHPNYDKLVTINLYKNVQTAQKYQYYCDFYSTRVNVTKTPSFAIAVTGLYGAPQPVYDPCIQTTSPIETCPEPEPDPGPQWDAPGYSVDTGTYGAPPSDVRLKSNITKIGTHQLGFGIYEYDIFDRREQGVLAQEILLYRPDAVSLGQDNYYRVNYYRLGLQRKIISII